MAVVINTAGNGDAQSGSSYTAVGQAVTRPLQHHCHNEHDQLEKTRQKSQNARGLRSLTAHMS